ncbi:STAS/SEC14 domain-containing protein [Bacillus alkalicellulosilyticus]|uniref:STAS/SEC14 domain-containing protein n=1 Tax=Alkalihalobacterium alkalicellulosilyticum TaxID=1912214 RepID=UPI000997871E|nr:STAS/SEC14 domain-containing protein [Bacillus alkalicellulosilyticus]
MWNVDVLNKEKKIISIEWSGKVTPEEVLEANAKLKEGITSLPSKGFDVIVNMSDVTVLIQETQKELVKHQAWLLEMGMKRAAVVVNGAVAKMQLKRTARESSHDNEYHFETPEEALQFLESNE